ncbi:MAG TPA: SPOR domain-containing protein [Solimonas sp.]|nr:SPOR domain-containing protein [Solimonas sp.]
MVSMLAAAGDRLPLDAVRVASPAELRRGEQISALRPGNALFADDSIVTGPQGRAALRLSGGGQLRLGGDSALLIHDATPPEPGSGGIARLVLERGALRLDARVPSPQLPQDYRLNVGRLRLRVFGGEAWTEISARGENVCLLSGAVEIVTDAGMERLDVPGECVLFGSGGNRLQVQADTGEALARKLLRTAFAGDMNARMAADQTPPAPAPVYEFLPPAVAAPAAEAPPATPPAIRTGPHWTLVLASFPDVAAAEAAARRWQQRGEEVEVRRFDTPSGARFRLTHGDYAEQAAARAGLAGLRGRIPEAAEAWLSPLPE